MHNLVSFIKEIHIYKKKELLNGFESFSKKQTRWFCLFAVIAFTSMIVLLSKINNEFMIEVPANGGNITEGIIGMPTLVNPVLALSEADKDLTILVYSGLMRKEPDGTFVPDLAESFETSSDGRSYTFRIKDNAKFQNGDKVTADDIIFTIEKIKNPLIKSPKKMDWDGIDVEKVDEKTVKFSLTKPYISFMDNTTIGILPSLVWKDVKDSEFSISPLNIKAVGSGPYYIKSVKKDNEGIPVEYSLKRFSKFILGKPHIKYIKIVSFTNEKDLVKNLLNGSIDQTSGISPENLSDIKTSKFTINTAYLPRVFGLFFNKNENKIFADPQVISAIDKAIDRKKIIDEVLNGYGDAIHNPITRTIAETNSKEKYDNPQIEEANTILDKDGWKMGTDGIRTKGGTVTTTSTKKVGKKTVTQKTTTTSPEVRLSFSVTTGDNLEFQRAVNLIKDQLLKIGIEVNIEKVYELGQLNQLIRAREYEALFFGQSVSHESDLYSFWHSSQKEDPGLNVAMYGNSKVDTILETLQKTLDKDQRQNKYLELAKEFDNDIPALLMYSPKYLYITSKKLKYINLDTITVPSDRFVSVYTWYADTDHVWKIFSK